MSRTKAYAKAGVDVDLANRLTAGLGAEVKKTHRSEVLGKVGGFGGLFRAKFPRMKDPVLVSSIDGVGTKLKVATLLERFDTIGEDLVNHCVNDIAVLGAEPLYFLDYLGTADLDQQRFFDVVSGIVRGCKNAGCALIGGETAQMPGVYHGKDFDLVGTIVGIVDKRQIIDGRKIRPGDAVLGLPSSGLHTNGYSLARELIFNKLGLQVTDTISGMRGKIGPALLKTHLCYLPQIRKIRSKVTIKGMAHITGGGLIDNLPRVLPSGTAATIELGSWPVPPLFRFLASEANIPDKELFQAFNMGIGMAIVVADVDVPKVLKAVKAYRIGTITKGDGTVKLEPKRKPVRRTPTRRR